MKVIYNGSPDTRAFKDVWQSMLLLMLNNLKHSSAMATTLIKHLLTQKALLLLEILQMLKLLLQYLVTTQQLLV